MDIGALASPRQPFMAASHGRKFRAPLYIAAYRAVTITWKIVPQGVYRALSPRVTNSLRRRAK